MYLALITLPLLGSIVSGFFGRKVGVVGSHIITCSCVILTTVLSFVAFFEVGFNNIPVSLHLFRWVDSESLNVYWGFNFDSLTVSMLIPVLVVSSLVHIYSIGYMNHDPHNQRFFSYLSLFTFMMIILVTANNFLLMFVGWEGVGVCSYLLVSFWFTRIAANQSSLSAFLTNRVGDCLLTVGMFALLWSFGNIDYTTVFSLAPFMNEDLITIIGICLLIGAMAKSSQVGLHIWLPQAMEGPTPVSALIHAATMVTAGVYLLMRSSPLLEYSSTVLICCLWLGAITTVFSSLIGLFQQDIKKVIAYSTMSQLGMMVIAVGLSSYNVALFHLVNHAFYKGLLFLGAGAVIHAVADNQDFRKYGALRQFLPLTYSVMLIASLSLVAFPFMTGFYSKDFILESAYGQFYFSSILVYFIATTGAMFTTLYSVKVLYLTFLANPLGPRGNYENAHEGDIYMSLPLIILAVFSIFFGYITKDIFIGLGSNFFADNSLFIHPNHEIMLDTEFAVPSFYKLLPLFFTTFLTIISLGLSEFMPKLLMLFKFTRSGYYIFGFFNQRFLIELFYNKYITGLVFKLGGQTTKVLDKGSVELVGPFGLEKVITGLSKSLSELSTGVVTTYAHYILLGLMSYILSTYLFLTDSNIIVLLIMTIFMYINKYNINTTNTYNKLASSLFNVDSFITMVYKVCKSIFETISKSFRDFYNNFSKKFLLKILRSSIIFRFIIFLIGGLLIYLGLNPKEVNMIIITLILSMYSYYLYKKSKSIKDGLYHLIQFLLILLIINIFWGCSIALLHLDLELWIYYLYTELSLDNHKLNMDPMGDPWGGDPSGGGPSGGGPSGGGPSGGGDPSDNWGPGGPSDKKIKYKILDKQDIETLSVEGVDLQLKRVISNLEEKQLWFKNLMMDYKIEKNTLENGELQYTKGPETLAKEMQIWGWEQKLKVSMEQSFNKYVLILNSINKNQMHFNLERLDMLNYFIESKAENGYSKAELNAILDETVDKKGQRFVHDPSNRPKDWDYLAGAHKSELTNKNPDSPILRAVDDLEKRRGKKRKF